MARNGKAPPVMRGLSLDAPVCNFALGWIADKLLVPHLASARGNVVRDRVDQDLDGRGVRRRIGAGILSSVKREPHAGYVGVETKILHVPRLM